MSSISSNAEPATPPVLLLHSSASSGRQWDGLVDALAGGSAAIAPDLYGYGRAPSWTGPGPLNLSAEAGRVAADIPAAVREIHVVGHSYGGAVALRLAVEQPWRVRSLTLIEPVAFHVLREGSQAERRLLDSVHRIAAKVIRGTLTGDYHRAMGQFVDYWNGTGAWKRTRPEVRERLSRHAPKVVLDFHAAINENTSLDGYRRRFDFPVAVLRGELSPAPTRRIAALLSERILGASLTTVPGAGHMLPITHPGRVNAAVVSHIERNRLHGESRAA